MVSTIFGSMNVARRAGPLFVLVTAGLVVGGGTTARAQVGTGGITGTTTGTLTASDIFIAVQQKSGTNLTERDRSRFLNQANCQCQVPAYLKAFILPSASLRAAAVSPSATVSMYVGNSCQGQPGISCCLKIGSMAFSEFRLSGMSATTSVDQLAKIWTCGTGVAGTGGSTGSGGSTDTGGVSGSGGTTGTGGVTGSGGATGTGGTGGTGTGGVSGNPTGDPCLNNQFGQTVWVFIGTSGDGTFDVAAPSLGFNVDPEPPIAPTNVSVAPANEALIVNWTPLDTATAADILGYQVLCTRGDVTQVFKTGTFTPAFDSCGAGPVTWPPRPTSMFPCSDLLPTSATSARLKILENDITYYVGVAAVDRQGNASVVDYHPAKPVLTKDFYYEYRHGDPQGAATGGYCAVSGVSSGGLTAAALGTMTVLGLALARRRSRRRR